MNSLLNKIRNWLVPGYDLIRHIPELMDRTDNRRLLNSEIDKRARLYEPYGFNNVKIGAYSYIAHNSHVINTEIGKFTSIGPNFMCGRGIHPVDGVSTSPMFYSTRKQNGFSISPNDKIREYLPIKIGNDVFIGINVTVLDGVTIGDGAVIAAGAVVTEDIPPYAIAGGVPAKVLRSRFSEDVINKLLKIRWWDLPVDELQPVEKHFFEVKKFIEIMSDGTV